MSSISSGVPVGLIVAPSLFSSFLNDKTKRFFLENSIASSVAQSVIDDLEAVAPKNLEASYRQ